MLWWKNAVVFNKILDVRAGNTFILDITKQKATKTCQGLLWWAMLISSSLHVGRTNNDYGIDDESEKILEIISWI